MDTIADIPGARRAIRNYLVHADGQLKPDTFERLEALVDSPSPVDVIVGSADLLYARRDELDDEGRTVVAQLASFAAANSWHGMGDGNRGGLIAQAMRRDMGQKAEPGQPAFQKADADPAPVASYVRQEPAADAGATA